MKKETWRRRMDRQPLDGRGLIREAIAKGTANIMSYPIVSLVVLRAFHLGDGS